jgi:NNP family nitrate/nitrite transporter-like MFS transporter
VPARRGRRWIDRWEPEDPAFWAGGGRAVARRNLITSIFVEHLGFSVWSLWSVLVLFMVPKDGFAVSAGQKFLLVSLVTLVGAVLRIPYSIAVGRFGGRNWTVASAAVLLIPLALAVWAMGAPARPFWIFLVTAAVAGVGGANFASSMTNINFFYPEREKGRALGLNAGGGNAGVAVVQLAGLLVIALATVRHPVYLPLIYIPLVVAATLCATRYMDNLSSARTDLRAQAAVARDRHCWLMSLLYVGTFGSFIGYSFAFGLVLQQQFHRTPLQAAALTFIGPLIGSLSRPAGGALADRLGGAAVTLWNFAGMAAGTGVILAASLRHSLPLFLAGFAVVFVLSGAGNGSTYKMIPAVFERRARAEIRAGQRRAAAMAQARRFSGAMLGIVGAVGALGGVAINLAFRQSYAADRSAVPALLGFLGFYALCAAVTYAVYLRSEERAEPARMAEPAGADYREVGA